MTQITDSQLALAQELPPACMAIRLKEAFFLVIVLFMGIAGIQLCIDKIYMQPDKTYEDILVHDSGYAQVDI